jgi:hypothetical protein
MVNGLEGLTPPKRPAYVREQSTAAIKRTRERMVNVGQQGLSAKREAVEKTQLLREAALARKREVAENSIVLHSVHALRILLSFPFFFIVGSFPNIAWLKQEQYHAHVLFINLGLMIVPYLVLSVIAELSDPDAAHIILWGCVIYCLAPVIIVVGDRVFKSHAQNKITEGTFCFRPAARLRPSFWNSCSVGGILLEFLQHSFYCFPQTFFDSLSGAAASDPASSDETDLQGWVEFSFPFWLNYSFFFWLVCAAVLFLSSVLVLRVVLYGQWAYAIEHSSMLWDIIYLLCGPLYVTISTVLVKCLVCDYSQVGYDQNWQSDLLNGTDMNRTLEGNQTTPALGYPVLVVDPSIRCWTGQHMSMATVALLSLTCYLTQSTLLPAATFKETMTYDEVDIYFVPLFLQGKLFLKAVFSAVYSTTFIEENIRIGALTLINLCVLLLDLYTKPCSLHIINELQQAAFCGCVWAGVSSLLSLQFAAACGDDGIDAAATLMGNASVIGSSSAADTSASKQNSLLVGMVLSGWTLIFGNFAWTSATKQNSIVHSVWHAFLQIRVEVREERPIHPRVLEPLVALTLSKHPEDISFALTCVPETVPLLGHKSVRVQFQAAWVLSNMGLQGSDFAYKLQDYGAIDKLLWLGCSRDRAVQLEALAAIVNLSMHERVAYEMCSEKAKWPRFLIGIVLHACTSSTTNSRSSSGNLSASVGASSAEGDDEFDELSESITVDLSRSSPGHERTKSAGGGASRAGNTAVTPTAIAFAAMALTNVTKTPAMREKVRELGGHVALVNMALLSREVMQQQSACKALANIALDHDGSSLAIFRAPGLVLRLTRLLHSRHVVVQEEAAAVFANLSAHPAILPLLLDKDFSVYPLMKKLKVKSWSSRKFGATGGVSSSLNAYCEVFCGNIRNRFKFGEMREKALKRRERNRKARQSTREDKAEVAETAGGKEVVRTKSYRAKLQDKAKEQFANSPSKVKRRSSMAGKDEEISPEEARKREVR